MVYLRRIGTVGVRVGVRMTVGAVIMQISVSCIYMYMPAIDRSHL